MNNTVGIRSSSTIRRYIKEALARAMLFRGITHTKRPTFVWINCVIQRMLGTRHPRLSLERYLMPTKALVLTGNRLCTRKLTSSEYHSLMLRREVHRQGRHIVSPVQKEKLLKDFRVC